MLQRLRAQLSLTAALTAALFALYVGVPRAAFFYHSHAGAERPHVHGDDGGAAELLAELYGHHHHHHDGSDVAAPHTHNHAAASPQHPAATAGRSSAVLHSDDGPANGHWHRQDRFQRGLSVAPVSIATSAPASPFHVAAPATMLRTAAGDLRARGPPLSPLV